MRTIERIGIVGAGTMGRRIAFACVIHGKQTRIFDISHSVGQEAIRNVRQSIEEYARNGQLSRDALGSAMPLFSLSPTLAECVSGTDAVIEAVPENVTLKRKVLSEIDAYCAVETIMGSNSSAIPGSWLADSTRRPQKLFNANFGLLDDLKVEVMGHPNTSVETLESAIAFIRDIGLVPILVRRENVGYSLNRIWRAVKKEVLYQLEHGHATAEDIDRGWMLDWHTSVGPCGLMDQIGLDVVRDIEMIYFQASGDALDHPPSFLDRMIGAGMLGLKSGQGFYSYPKPEYQRPGWLDEGKNPSTAA